MASSSKYELLRSSSAEDEERLEDVQSQSDFALEKPGSNGSRRLSTCTVLLTMLNFLLLLVTVTMVYAVSKSPPQEARFATDFADAQRAVRYEQLEYSQKLFYNETSEQVELERYPDETTYFGDPSPEIDAAWDELLYGEFMAMRPEESAPFEPELRPLPNGQFHFELQVTHDLRCMNAVRKHLDHEYYKDSVHSQNSHGVKWKSPRDHLDHCLNLLLQGIMCHSDLTPSPLYAWPGVNQFLGRSATHTCRDFKVIKQWYHERNADGSGLTEIEGKLRQVPAVSD